MLRQVPKGTSSFPGTGTEPERNRIWSGERGWIWAWSGEVVALLDVVDEAGVGGHPAQGLLRDGGGDGHVGVEHCAGRSPLNGQSAGEGGGGRRDGRAVASVCSAAAWLRGVAAVTRVSTLGRGHAL